MEQSYAEGDEIKDVNVGLHEIKDELEVLQLREVVLLLEVLEDVEDECVEFVDDGVLIVVG